MRRWPMLIVVLALALPAWGDEGMWTFQNFPSELVRQKYGVNISREWLERVRTATVRLSNCTASFVSSDGLMLTNHHCAEACLAEHSSKDSDLLERGFATSERPRELRCGTQIADVLMETEDVTRQVREAEGELNAQSALEARKRTLTRLEQACEETSRRNRRTGPLKCESVELYDGAIYYLYKYRRYDDVRLVFAPEQGIAAFGGDPDNFQFPRWCLDMTLLRAYQGGRPARTPNHLKIDFAGPEAGQPVFVAGHPGNTDRLLTVAQLLAQRDTDLTPSLLRSAELRGRYIQFGKSSAQEYALIEEPLNTLENGLKVRRKLLDALHDDEQLKRKAAQEAELRARVLAQPGADVALADSWKQIEMAQQSARHLNLPYAFLEAGVGFNSRLFRYARVLVRVAAERSKPNADRLREYADAALPRVEQQLRADLPLSPEIEILTLSLGLDRMREWLGPDYPIVRRLLSDDSPDTLATRLVGGTKLADPAVRTALWQGGEQAIEASHDPMLELARAVDPDARALRKRYEDEVDAPVEAASAQIARARFALLGTSTYPDANFTLRLSFGTVRGWREDDTDVEPFTRLRRLFERATGHAPFRVPDRWVAAKDRLDLDTKFDLSTDNDIVGGNSGSPLINAKGDIVGLMFDGNIHSISGAYWFDDKRNRAVAVHPAIILAALTKVYDAKELLRELGAR
jgi:hypothetical protein